MDLREAVGVAVAPDAEGTAVAAGAAATGNGQGPPLAITVAGLTKNYGEIEAVRGIDFDVPTGETFGFLGPNGAGKSTTIKILCTLARPTSGDRPGGRSRRGHASGTRCGATSAWCSRTPRSTTTSPASRTCVSTPSCTAVPAAAVAPRMQQVLEMVGLWDRRDSLVRRSPAA